MNYTDAIKIKLSKYSRKEIIITNHAMRRQFSGASNLRK
jgi:hypothetical protein